MADGEQALRVSSRRSALTAAAAPVELERAPATSQAPYTRSRTGHLRIPSAQPAQEVPEGSSAPALSEKAAGKWKAATRGDTRRTAPSSTQGTMTLKDIQPEKINNAFVDHVKLIFTDSDSALTRSCVCSPVLAHAVLESASSASSTPSLSQAANLVSQPRRRAPSGSMSRRTISLPPILDTHTSRCSRVPPCSLLSK